MESPRVTIITPSFNRASYIGEVIESVLSQHYPNLEYLVIDDGSTDDSHQVIGAFADRLTFIAQANMGETRTVNKGLAMATGEIIGVVNSDDPLYPGAIHQIVAYMAAHPEVLVVYPDWHMIDPEGHVIRPMTPPTYDYMHMLRAHECLPGPGTFFRRRLVEAIGGRDLRFRWTADYDFWLRAGLVGPFARLPKTLATFRVHPGSASVNMQGQAMAEEHITMIEALYSRPDLPEAVLRVKDEAFSSAYYVGALVSGERTTRLRLRYFWRALAACPLKYLGPFRHRLPVMALWSLPRAIREPLRAIRMRFQRPPTAIPEG